MTMDFAGWQRLMWVALIVLVAVVVAYRLLSAAAARRHQRERVVAARARSAHAPLEIPTSRGGLAGATSPGSLWGELSGSDPDGPLVVDEQPLLHLRYLDTYGNYVEREIQVEMLDLHRKAIIAKGDSLHDPRVFPLERIAEASDTASGRRFDLGRWVEAVRVARRKREIEGESQMGSLS